MKLAWPRVSMPGTLEVPRPRGDENHCLGRCEGARYSWLFGKLCEPRSGRRLPAAHPSLPREPFGMRILWFYLCFSSS